MSDETPLFVVHLLGFVAFFWHGLYVLTRGDRAGISRLTATTALVTSGLFFTQGLAQAFNSGTLDQQVLVDRIIWSFNVVPAALWLHLSLRLNPYAAAKPWRLPVIYAAYGAAVVICLLGTFTELIYAHRVHGHVHAAGQLYLLYVVYVLACAGLALMNLVQMQAPGARMVQEQASATTVGPGSLTLDSGSIAVAGVSSDGTSAATVRGTEVHMLIAGGACFLVAVCLFTALNLLDRTSPGIETPAWLLLLVGLGAVGGTVGVQSNLLLGKDLRRDFLYNATGLLLLLVPFLVISAAVIGFDSARARLLALLLAGVLAAGHTLYDVERRRLDALFFTPEVQEERAAARAYADALASPPAGPSPELATRKQFDDAVRRALTHLSDPTKLATSPLLNLETVARGVRAGGEEDDRLTRAAALKEILLELLDNLRPADTAGGITGDAFRFYNCLYYPYVQGITRRRAPTVLRQLQERRQRTGGPRTDPERVVDWLLQVDEDTFYKWQRRGSDTIAATLREREAAAGGMALESGGAVAGAI